jgi:tRNA-splicing ligase RtcB
MVHSGSRNFGYKIAKHYNDLAKDLCEKWHSETTKDLAFLPGKRATEYLDAMNYALAFAEENRRRIMACVKQAMIDATIFGDDIDIHHNYARLENHYGKNVMVHRKGATSARAGEVGIIPGSQGTSSYIVEGKGCSESFESCSHGAGRKMGRKQAQKTLDLQEQKDILDKQGVVHSIRTEDDLDEAPGAYKDIQAVMENQKDLVSILVELKPLAVIKG